MLLCYSLKVSNNKESGKLPPNLVLRSGDEED